MKTRLVLLIAGIAVLWGTGTLGFLRFQALRREEALAFSLLRIQDEAHLLALIGSRPIPAGAESISGWSIKFDPLIEDPSRSWTQIDGATPEEASLKSLLSSLRQSNLVRGSLRLGESHSERWGVGFSKKQNVYYVVGQRLPESPNDSSALLWFLQYWGTGSTFLAAVAWMTRWTEKLREKKSPV